MKNILLLLVLGCSAVCYRPAGYENEEPANLAKRVVDEVAQGDVAAASQKFHYPADEAPSLRKSDVDGVAASLRILSSDFGKISGIRRTTVVPDAYSAFVAGGTVSFWAHHPDYTRFTYEVAFGKYGPGWMFVDVSRIDGRLGIRTLSFALSSHRPGSEEAITSTTQHLLKVVHP
jgi:hypothetical protein